MNNQNIEEEIKRYVIIINLTFCLTLKLKTDEKNKGKIKNMLLQVVK